MKATKIKMYTGKEDSNSLLEIDMVFIEDCTKPGYFKKAVLHDYLEKNPGSIHVDISPFPELLPKTSVNNQKYVASSPNSSTHDNLLKLPRE